MSSHRTRALVLVLAACASGPLSAPPAAAQDAGAWRTFLRPYDYVQMVAEGDTVWCATAQAGLVLFHPSDGSFGSITRAPGGLAGNVLTSIVRDHGGNLWMGTDGSGASRLDADRGAWGLVNAFDGLRSESVRCLAADPARDSVWIGTEDGIALWNGEEIAGTLPDGVNPSPFASDVITGIVVKSDSQFIATAAGAYLRRPQGGGSVIDTINAGLIGVQLDGMATDGVDVFAHVLGIVQRWSGPLRTWLGTGSIGTTHRLQSSGGQVFASTTTGIHRWNGNGWTLVSPALVSGGALGQVFAAASPGPGGPVYAANVNGVYTIPAGGGTHVLRTPQTPPGNNVLNLIVEGPRLYVNTWTRDGFTGGVGRFDGSQWRNWYSGACQTGCDTTFLDTTSPFALVADRDGRKWVACWSSALEIMDDAGPVPQFTRPTWTTYTYAQHTFGAAAVLDSSGGVWFGMDTNNLGVTDPIGLEYYDSTGTYVANYAPGANGLRGNGKIKALTVDSNHRLWVGHSGEGLQYFDRSAGVFRDVIPLESLDFRGLDAPGDTLWASTTNDVRAYGTRNGTLLGSYPIPSSPDQFALNPIAVATDGRVWLGTTNGVRVYNRDGSTFADYTTANSPLVGNAIRAIRVDPLTGAVWIGSANGLNRFDPFWTPPPPPELARLEVRPFPNPARLDGIGTTIRLTGNATSYSGAVYDLSGRVLRRFSGAPDRAIVWDGRDGDGVIVRPGVYFLRVEAGGRAATSRIVLLR